MYTLRSVRRGRRGVATDNRRIAREKRTWRRAARRLSEQMFREAIRFDPEGDFYVPFRGLSEREIW